MTEPALTDEQTSVVTAPATDRMLVTAGPGTGKTHTLVARIGHLVENQDVAPGSILALSFSRAAVGELRRRLGLSGDDAGRVAPVTFDSFATRTLRATVPEGAWIDESFDGRIEAALANLDSLGDLLEDIEHVCVDELQDLVGVRMRFVRSLLDHLDVGFTLLGDPAQGVYDFSLAEGETAERDGAPALYEWLRDRYAGELVEHSLTVNHRARTELACRAAGLGPLVVAEPEKAALELVGLLDEAPRLPGLGSLRNSAGAARTAVLCRNNGQAMWVSRVLGDQDIDHFLQRRATNRTVAPWVAALLLSTGGGVINKRRFTDVVGSLPQAPTEPDQAWALLRRIGRIDAGVDLARVVERLRNGGIPDELQVTQDAPVVVSTVHRAKGLEFDRVVVVNEGWNAPFDYEDARTLFVAITRTVRTLATCEVPDLGGRLAFDRPTGRWLHLGWQRWQRRGIEVTPDDIDVRQPAGTHLLQRNAADIQDLLATRVSVGDPVVLELIRPRVDGNSAYFRACWEDTGIGVMSDSFGEDLVRVLKYARGWKYPKRITGLRIDAVRTVGGDSLVTEQEGLGPGGAWLSPTVAGLGKFEWE